MVHQPTGRLDDIFAALGEPTRRAVVERLAVADATVAELAAPFAMSLQAIIKHIRVLEDAGLVTRTRIGRVNHVALVPGVLQAAACWLNTHTPGELPAVRLVVAAERHVELLQGAHALWGELAPRMALIRRALADEPAGEDFDPQEATVRALRAQFGRRPALEEALRLYDALGSGLDAVAAGGDLDGLRGIVLPLGRLMFDLRPYWPAEVAA
ncbi:MAG: transcriptional regulator [Cyanobacteria bacterium RYN_339]|nr:transcriptional regulator [Cyanobacteria bacterium RYN_339]